MLLHVGTSKVVVIATHLCPIVGAAFFARCYGGGRLPPFIAWTSIISTELASAAAPLTLGQRTRSIRWQALAPQVLQAVAQPKTPDWVEI